MSRKERKCNGMKKILYILSLGLFLFVFAVVLFFVHVRKPQTEERPVEKVLVMREEVFVDEG